MKDFQFDASQSLYKQIKSELKKQILSGKLHVGEKIPSERELCEMFGVSRITVRQAINEAVNEGLLFTVQGKGTFIASNSEMKISQKLLRITPFGSSLASRGMLAETSIVGYSLNQVDFALSKILNLDITAQIFNLRLLGKANGLNMVFYDSFFQAEIGMKLYQEAVRWENQSLPFSTTDLYKELGDPKPAFVEQTFEAVIADEGMANILFIEAGAPLFLVSSIIYTRNNLPVEFRKAYYRGDKYKFHIKREIV